MSNPGKSLTQLSINTYSLLSPDQRRIALRNILFSIVQAFVEVVSLTALVPLFYQLINNSWSSTSASSFQQISNFLSRFPWYVIAPGIVIVFIIKNVFGFLLTRHQSKLSYTISVSLSERLYNQFYKQTWADYVKDNSAETVRRIKSTPSDFAHYIVQSYLLLITEACICLFMLGGMLWFDYRVILIIIILCLPVSILYYLFRRKILLKINKAFRELTPQASIILTQGIDSFAEARIYNKESYFINRFMEIRRITAQHLANITTATSLPPRLFEIAGILCFTGVVAYVNTFNTNQQGIMVLLALLSITIYRVVPSMNRILIYISQIQSYSYTVDELKESLRPTAEVAASQQRDITFEKDIQFNNVSYQYKGSAHHQLKNLNVSIKKGEFVILEGPSGAGKTTFLHLLAGLINDNEGDILIDNIPLRSCYRSWQNILGIVPQASTVLQGTLLTNIAFGENEKEIDIPRVHKAMELANLKEFIPNISTLTIGENGLTLSGGQRQRVLLARALYRDPDVLLLDEVTNQLDEKNKIDILKTLYHLSSIGKTIILASHDATVRNYATQVLHFDNKTVREIKSTTSLI